MINCEMRKHQSLIIYNYLCSPSHISWFQNIAFVDTLWWNSLFIFVVF